jgi:hypothetical protein
MPNILATLFPSLNNMDLADPNDLNAVYKKPSIWQQLLNKDVANKMLQANVGAAASHKEMAQARESAQKSWEQTQTNLENQHYAQWQTDPLLQKQFNDPDAYHQAASAGLNDPATRNKYIEDYTYQTLHGPEAAGAARNAQTMLAGETAQQERRGIGLKYGAQRAQDEYHQALFGGETGLLPSKQYLQSLITGNAINDALTQHYVNPFMQRAAINEAMGKAFTSANIPVSQGLIRRVNPDGSVSAPVSETMNAMSGTSGTATMGGNDYAGLSPRGPQVQGFRVPGTDTGFGGGISAPPMSLGGTPPVSGLPSAGPSLGGSSLSVPAPAAPSRPTVAASMGGVDPDSFRAYMGWGAAPTKPTDTEANQAALLAHIKSNQAKRAAVGPINPATIPGVAYHAVVDPFTRNPLGPTGKKIVAKGWSGIKKPFTAISNYFDVGQ